MGNKKGLVKTYLLENDDYFRQGQEEFCKSFDPNFEFYNTSPKNQDMGSALRFAMFMCQPQVERLISCSEFIMPGGTFGIDENYTSDLTKSSQIKDFLNLLLPIVRFREVARYKGLTVEIQYANGTSRTFIDDVNDEKWGNDFKRTLCLIVRQNVENLTINIWDKDYKFIKKLEESDFIL